MLWHTAKNILCIRLDTIGDVLMTTPAIRALKHSHPNRQITLMTSAIGATVVPLIPEIDRVMVYDAPWLKATSPRQSSTIEFMMIEQLRAAQFDAVVIFSVYSQNPLPSAFLCYLADIPLRLAHCHENPYQLLTHWIPDPEPATLMRHEVRRQLDLVASVGCELGVDRPKDSTDRIRLKIPQAALQSVQQQLVQLGVDHRRPWIVIHPGASAPSRRYPPEQFAIVAQKLVQEVGLQIVFTGTHPELELVESIRDEMAAPSYSLVDRLSIVELAALLQLAPMLLSNNTGPIHIAAGVGTPIVDLYALTNPQHMPWQVPCRVLFQDVPCRYCYRSICPQEHHHCLRQVTPEQVVAAILDLFQETRSTFSRALLNPAMKLCVAAPPHTIS